MARFYGKDASATFNAVAVGQLEEWSVNTGGMTVITSAAKGESHEEVRGGVVRGATAQLIALYDIDNTGQTELTDEATGTPDGNPKALVITLGSGKTITCQAVLTASSLNDGGVDGVTRVTFDFSVDGPVAIASV